MCVYVCVCVGGVCVCEGTSCSLTFIKSSLSQRQSFWPAYHKDCKYLASATAQICAAAFAMTMRQSLDADT